jgi:hypothetical protein
MGGGPVTANGHRFIASQSSNPYLTIEGRSAKRENMLNMAQHPTTWMLRLRKASDLVAARARSAAASANMYAAHKRVTPIWAEEARP